jgi:hypothetical protein
MRDLRVVHVRELVAGVAQHRLQGGVRLAHPTVAPDRDTEGRALKDHPELALGLLGAAALHVEVAHEQRDAREHEDDQHEPRKERKAGVAAVADEALVTVGGTEQDEADAAGDHAAHGRHEPRRARVRGGEARHRRDECRSPDQHVRAEPAHVEPAPQVVTGAQGGDHVAAVGDHQRQLREEDQPVRERTAARQQTDADQHGDPDEVEQRVGDRDHSGRAPGDDHVAADEEQPAEEAEARGDQRGVEVALPVTAREVAVEQQEQARDEDEVAHQVEHVRDAREGRARPRQVDDVSGEEEELGERDPPPSGTVHGLVQLDPDDHGDDRGEADQLVCSRASAHGEMQRDQGHAKAEVGTCHERHRVKVSTGSGSASMGHSV